MTLFEKVKTCVYAASIHRRTKNNTSFKGWANAWLLGVDRSVSGSESVANGHRSAGSLSASQPIVMVWLRRKKFQNVKERMK